MSCISIPQPRIDIVKLLIVDDDLLICQGLEEMIGQLIPDCVVCGCAPDGNNALQLIKRSQPDIVLSDIQMPHMDGITLAQSLQQRYPEIVVVFLSGHGEFSYAQASLKLNVFDYILKPVGEKELRDTLNRAMGESQRRQQERQRTELLECHRSGKVAPVYTALAERNLTLALRTGDMAKIQEWLKSLRQSLESLPLDMEQYVHIISGLLNTLLDGLPGLESGLVGELEQCLFACSGIEDLWETVEECVNRLVQSLINRRRTNKLAEQARQYIENHYGDDISLQMIADHLNLNPNYLSGLFRTHTGRNFLDYLTEVRMRHAVELLQNPTLKVYQVAAKVGYEDANYFGKLFKKTTGVTPGDFRDSISG